LIKKVNKMHLQLLLIYLSFYFYTIPLDYLFLEEVFNASIDFSMFGLSLQCLKKIKSNFPDSQKVVYMQSKLIDIIKIYFFLY
jgi:hypothetical protein